MTSDADLFVAAEGSDGEQVSFDRFDTGLDDECEFEGLTSTADGRHLLLLCKATRRRASIDALSIFTWSIEEHVVTSRRALPLDDISVNLGMRRLHPSGIARHPTLHSFYIVAARERALIELDEKGDLLSAILLPKESRHPQAEGIEIAANGDLILADEGASGRPRITIYRTQD